MLSSDPFVIICFAGEADTFTIVVSMISGKTLPVELPRNLLQRKFVDLDESRGASPVDDQSPLVS